MVLKQLASQLWQSKLSETLQVPQIKLHLTADECSTISTFEQLFAILLAKQLVTPSDHQSRHSLLCAVLNVVKGLSSREEPSHSCTTENLCTISSGSCSEQSTFPRSSSCPSRISSYTSCFRKPATNSLKDFKLLLKRIGKSLDSEDLGALKLLCSSVLSHRQLAAVADALDLFKALRYKCCISSQKPAFLHQILRDIGRWDLSNLVDRYTCPKMSTDEPTLECNAGLKENGFKVALGQRESYKFVLALKQLGDELDMDDLAAMNLLAGTCIPESKLDKVGNVYELFILLNERGKLSENDLFFLEQILYDKLHLVSRLYDLGFGCKPQAQSTLTASSLPPAPDKLLMNFRQLLKTIGSRLTHKNIQDIKYLCPDEMGSLSRVHSGIELLSLLERRREIEPTNVTFLLNVLGEVGRKDLCAIVEQYAKTYSPHSGGAKPTPVKGCLDQTMPTTSFTNSPTRRSHIPDGCRDNTTALVKTLSTQLQTNNHDDIPLTESGDTSITDRELLYRQILAQEASIKTLQEKLEQHESELKAREEKYQEQEKRFETELCKRDQRLKQLTEQLALHFRST